jgi:hypothetical protein
MRMNPRKRSNGSPGCGWAENFAAGPRVFNTTHADGRVTVSAPLTACSFMGTLLSALRNRGINV